MDKKRHEKTPLDHARELRAKGEINFVREVEDLARNSHTETLAQLTGAKKRDALLILIVEKLQAQEAEINGLKRKISTLSISAA